MRLTCKQAAALLSQGLDRKLSPWERTRLRLHLLACDACRNFVKQIEFIRRAIRRVADRG
ncbi:MAG: zf-HC2 domain-containing protein [Betaproteobacteria bacterium]|nr:zf-HC2 domain-containing protein [Betaproteobacteria bacterium]